METSQNPGLPPLFRRHVRRPRLTRPLDESTAQTILFTAPAGYGKTALAAEWLETTRHVAWYRATTGSADVAAVSVGIADCVAHFMPGAGDRLRRRVRMGDAPEKMVRALAELLAEDLSEWPSEAWLVIDDYHLLRPSKAADEFVDWLLMLAPIRLLITTRQRPRWATARRLLQGEIVELTKDQLAMTTAEANKVLSSRPPASVRALIERAEGWPVLLGLAALVASDELPESDVVQVLFRYLAEEVFLAEPDDVRRFLVIAAIPGSFDTVFARDVAGLPAPEEMFAYLTARGLLEGTPGEASLHPLLRDFLVTRLETTIPRSEMRTVLNGCLAYSRARRRWGEAFDLAIRTDRLHVAADVAAEGAPSLLASGRLETLVSWLNAVRAVSLEHPALVLAEADLLTRLGSFATAASLADHVANSPTVSKELAPKAWCLVARAHHFLSDPAESLKAAKQARHVALTSEDRREAQWRIICAAKELELADLADYVAELGQLGSAGLEDRLRMACAQIYLGFNTGSLRGLSEQFHPILAELNQGTDPAVASGALMIFGDLALGGGDYRSAHDLSRQLARTSSASRFDFALASAWILKSKAQIGLRRFGHAASTLANLGSVAQRTGDRYLQLEHQNIVARLRISQELPTRVFSDPVGIELYHLPTYTAEAFALSALGAAAAGDGQHAMALVNQANAVSTSIVPRALGEVASLIVSMDAGINPRTFRLNATALLKRHFDSGYLEGFVLAFRARPELVAPMALDPVSARLAAKVLAASNDEALGQRMAPPEGA